MGKFLSKLVVSPIDDASWVLDAPLSYFSATARRVIKVPEGFKTDFASVPRLPLVFLVTGDTCHEAAVVHDYLYTVRVTDRKTADAVLLEACADTGVALWRRYIVYYAVRAFGWSHW